MRTQNKEYFNCEKGNDYGDVLAFTTIFLNTVVSCENLLLLIRSISYNSLSENP